MPDDDNFPNFPNDFFNNIQKFIEELLKNTNFSDFEKLFEDEFGQNPFVWGFSFNKGPDGKPKLEQFGDIIRKMGYNNPNDRQFEHERVREPLTDIIEEEDSIRVLVELPGVEKNQIDLSATDTTIKIKAQSNKRFYKKSITLPDKIIPQSSKAKFNNGVLEITFERVTPDQSKKIDIE